MKKQLRKLAAVSSVVLMGGINFGFDCPEQYYPHQSDCNKYFECQNGELVLRECPAGLHFNAASLVCDYPENVGCEAEGGSTGGNGCGTFIKDGSVGWELFTSLETHIIAAQSVYFNANAEGSIGGRTVKAGTTYASTTVPVSQGYYKECSSKDLFNVCNNANEGYMIPCP